MDTDFHRYYRQGLKDYKEAALKICGRKIIKSFNPCKNRKEKIHTDIINKD